MTQASNNYDRLYENMKQRFTVRNENSVYTLGEFMLMKATVKKAEAALPVALRPSATKTERAVANVVSYVNDKLIIKQTPVQDKTIKAFPLRASASAFLSAAVACAFMLSFCIIGANVIKNAAPAAEADTNVEEVAPVETAEAIFE